MSEKRRITLKDIAKELGISVSTASRALKAHPDIAEETIKMVKEYAEKHHYVPNALAVNFRRSRTYSIGLIVPELVHYFFSSVISGAIDEAKRNGYNVLVSQSNDILDDEISACRRMLASSVDGLLISISNETVEGTHIKEFLDEGKPVVQFDKVTDCLDTPKVIVDDFEGAYKAVTHLIEQGYTKIAHIRGRMDVKNSEERCRGYKKAMEDHGLKMDPDWIKICAQITQDEGFEFAKQLMDSHNPPDAIFCITDLVAIGVMKYLKKNHIPIPQKVGVIGFSNWQLADVASPSLSSVDQHAYQIGTTSMQLLIQILQQQIAEAPEIVEIKTELIVRESSVKN